MRPLYHLPDAAAAKESQREALPLLMAAGPGAGTAMALGGTLRVPAMGVDGGSR